MGTNLIGIHSQSPDWIKAAMKIGLPAVMLGLLRILLWYRVEMRRIDRIWPADRRSGG